MNLEIRKLSSLAKDPEKMANEFGLELFPAIETDVWIPPHKTECFKTDLIIALPEGTFGSIYARPAFSTQQGLRIANGVGIIIPKFSDEIIIPIHNDSEEDQIITPDSKIAQLIILPYEKIENYHYVGNIT